MMEGWLLKKGHVRRNWKERYFILKPNPPVIYYYEKKPKNEKAEKAEALGAIPLHKGNIGLDSERKDPLSFTIQSIQADGEKKNFVVQAKTEESMKEWIEAITKAAKTKQADPPPASPKKGSFRNPPGLSSTSVQPESSARISTTPVRSRAETFQMQNEVQKPGNSSDLYCMKFCFDGGVSHRNLLSEPRFANVGFVMPNGKSVLAHDFILKMRCAELYQLLESKGKKKRGANFTTIEWKDFEINLQNPFSVLIYALPFIYTDYMAEDSGFEMGVAVEMHKFADKMKIEKMKVFLEGWISKRIDMKNVYQVLKTAHEIQTENIKSIALGFAYAHLKDFVTNKEKTATLGLDLFHEVVAMQTEDAEDLNFFKPGPEPESTVVQNYKNLYISLQTDPNEGDAFCVLCDEKIRFHKAILDGHSKGFEDAFASLSKDNLETDATSLLQLPPNTPPDVFRTILKFVYYGEQVKSPTLAPLTLKYAKRMLMHDFQAMLEEKMKTLTPNTIVAVLQVTAQQQQQDPSSEEAVDAYRKAIDFFVQNSSQVDLNLLKDCDKPILLDIISNFVANGGSSSSSSSSSHAYGGSDNTSPSSSTSSRSISPSPRSGLPVGNRPPAKAPPAPPSIPAPSYPPEEQYEEQYDDQYNDQAHFPPPPSDEAPLPPVGRPPAPPSRPSRFQATDQ